MSGITVVTDQLEVVTTHVRDTIVSTPKVTEIVSVARQGPPGRDGNALAGNINMVAGENLSGHVVVISDGSTIKKLDYTNINHLGSILGITTNAALLGDPVEVRTSGEMINPGWSFTSGAVFANITAQIGQTPTPNGIYIQLGTIIDPTSILVNIKRAIWRT